MTALMSVDLRGKRAVIVRCERIGRRATPLLIQAELSKMTREAHPIRAAERLNKDAAFAAVFVPELRCKPPLIWTVLPDTGGVDATSRRSREASFDGADGREARARQGEALIVVGNGTLSKEERIPKH